MIAIQYLFCVTKSPSQSHIMAFISAQIGTNSIPVEIKPMTNYSYVNETFVNLLKPQSLVNKSPQEGFWRGTHTVQITLNLAEHNCTQNFIMIRTQTFNATITIGRDFCDTFGLTKPSNLNNGEREVINLVSHQDTKYFTAYKLIAHLLAEKGYGPQSTDQFLVGNN